MKRGDKLEKDRVRVVIADDEPVTRMALRELLETENYRIVGEAADGFDAIEMCRKTIPDLALMDIKMPLLDGLSASKIIFEEQLARTIILITAYSEKEQVEAAKACGVCGYLVKPIDEKTLISNIEVSMARSEELHELRRNIKKVTQRLEDRGVIERAKGWLMKNNDISEQDAYDYIRKLSQTKNISMRKIAEIILMKMGG